MPGFSYDGSTDNKYMYNGKEHEDENNVPPMVFELTFYRLRSGDSRLRLRALWYHYGVRFYDPELGRWHSIDPADQFFSPYVYCHNDPVNFLDPDGSIQKDADGRYIYVSWGRGEGKSGDRTTIFQFGYVYADTGNWWDRFLRRRGHKIQVLKNLKPNINPQFNTDCHGFTFIEEKYWIDNDQVRAILKYDGYIKYKTPQVGDVTVFTDKKGDVVHSAVVKSIDSDGNIIYNNQAGTFINVTTPMTFDAMNDIFEGTLVEIEFWWKPPVDEWYEEREEILPLVQEL